MPILSQALELPLPQTSGLNLTGLVMLDGNPRLWDAVVSSTVLSEPVHVAVHLSADCDSRPDRRYPVLLLLHGHGDAFDRALPSIRQATQSP